MEEPASLLPLAPFGIEAHDQIHLLIQVIDGDPPERTALHIEQPEIVNALLSAVPDLILLETAQGLLLLHFDQTDMLGPFVRIGGDPFAQEKNQKADRGGNGQDGEGQSGKG